jgi:hypothetical protein
VFLLSHICWINQRSHCLIPLFSFVNSSCLDVLIFFVGEEVELSILLLPLVAPKLASCLLGVQQGPPGTYMVMGDGMAGGTRPGNVTMDHDGGSSEESCWE